MTAFTPFHDRQGTSGFNWLCPGCGEKHSVPTQGDIAWGWDGDMERPTFTPSVRVRWRDAEGIHVCHFFIRGGVAEFCADCTHENAGKKLLVVGE